MSVSLEQKLKNSVHTTARKIALEVATYLNLEFEQDALDMIAELIWRKLSLYGADLEAFEKHAKRSTITIDDVKLLARRNHSLKELVDTKIKATASARASPATKPSLASKSSVSKSTSSAKVSDVPTKNKKRRT